MLPGGSAGVTDAGSSVACGKCACEVWRVWVVLLVPVVLRW